MRFVLFNDEPDQLRSSVLLTGPHHHQLDCQSASQ